MHAFKPIPKLRHWWLPGLSYDLCRRCGIQRRNRKGQRVGGKPDFFYRKTETSDWQQRIFECVDPRQGKLFAAEPSPLNLLGSQTTQTALPEEEATTEREADRKERAPIPEPAPVIAQPVGPPTAIWDYKLLEAEEHLPVPPPAIIHTDHVPPPVTLGFKLLHPLENRKDFIGKPNCDVTLGVLDRRLIGDMVVGGKLQPSNPEGDIIDAKIRKMDAWRKQGAEEDVWPDEEDLF